MENAADTNPDPAQDEPAARAENQPPPDILVSPEIIEPGSGPPEDEPLSKMKDADSSDRSRLKPPVRAGGETATRRMSKFRRSNSGVQSLQETLKEKQVGNHDAHSNKHLNFPKLGSVPVS